MDTSPNKSVGIKTFNQQNSHLGLKVCSFNCKNAKTSSDELRKLQGDNDIIMLQETWLRQDESDVLSELSAEFYVKSVSGMDTSTGLISGRPYGGIAILWRKSLGSLCKIVDFNDSRLLGIDLNIGGNNVRLVNIYLPFDSVSNENEYIDYLTRMCHICEHHCNGYVYFIGDFNANLQVNHEGTVKSRFGRELISLCDDEDLVISDYQSLGTSSYTFVSYAHKTVSWLDHIVTTHTGHGRITDIGVDNTYVTSDHLPICMVLNFDCTHSQQTNKRNRRAKIIWSELSSKDVEDYRDKCDNSLSDILSDTASMICNDMECSKQEHKDSIGGIYTSIVKALHSASSHLSPKQRGNFKPTPGWNEYVREAHSDARDAFILWQDQSKPRCGHIYELMARTRAEFKRCLRHCKANESKARADALARKFLAKDKLSFWNDIRKINRSRTSDNAMTIEDVNGDENICEFWKSHYRELLNCNNHTRYKSSVIKFLKDNQAKKFIFSTSEIQNAIAGLKRNKSAGLDGLQSEHLKYAGDCLAELLTMLFNTMITHGYLPDDLMKTIIIPIVKDRNEVLTSKDNYRPIAVTTVCSKLLERALLDKMHDKLYTLDNQYGFKAKSGTDMCVFTLKQITDYYLGRSSPVYICYLDASKAFDRINHWTLFSKLIQRNIPYQIIRLMVSWYENQTFCVSWGSYVSSCFHVTNGVRQGGVLSPVIFGVYMDELSDILNAHELGCKIKGSVINHLMYADDTCIIAPSPSALQKLLNICSDFAYDNSVVFNEEKTKLMCCRPKMFSKLHVPNINLNGKAIPIVAQKKYLGIIVQDNLQDGLDMKRQVKSIYARGNLMVNRFGKCSVGVKNYLFRAYFSNAYGGQLWSVYNKTEFQKVKVAYNDVYRRLCNIRRGESISAIFVQNYIDTFNIVIRKLVYSFICRLCTSKNTLIQRILGTEEFLNCRLMTEWHNTLYCKHPNEK